MAAPSQTNYMTPITQRKLAELAGVTPQQIYKVVRADPPKVTLVQVNGKPKIDLDGHLTAQYLKGRKPKPPKLKTIKDRKDAPINPYQHDADDYKSTSNNPSGLAPNGSHSETSKLKDDKLKEQIEEIRIKNQQKRGNLIPKKLIIKVFNKIYSIHQNMLKPLGVNVSPKISSVYNSHNASKAKEICELIDKPEDQELKTEISKILNLGEPDRINEINQILEDAVGGILANIKRTIDKFLEFLKNEDKDD